MEGRRVSYMRCRKDTQCKCSMCEESIDATRDLRSASKPMFQSEIGDLSTFEQLSSLRLPVSNEVRVTEGRKARKDHVFATPVLEDEVQSSVAGEMVEPNRKVKFRERRQGVRKLKVWRRPGWDFLNKVRRWWRIWVLILALAILLEVVVPGVTTVVLEPKLGAGFVMDLAEQCGKGADALNRLLCFQSKLSRALADEHEVAVVNCTGGDSNWKLNEIGNLVHSTCELYSSMAERVVLWGYPLETAGVLGRSLVDRSFYILSGRVLQWHEGRMEHLTHTGGERWMHPKWTASTVKLDRNTWILEHRPVAFSKGLGNLEAIFHMLRFKMPSLEVMLNWIKTVAGNLSSIRSYGSLPT